MEEVAAEEEEVELPMTMDRATKELMKKALIHDGLRRGLHECAKALDASKAQLCILASNCEEAGYTKLITALCQEHEVKLLTVEDSKELGEWAGLCKLDAEGNARKVVSCSAVVVTDFGEESAGLDFVMKEIGRAA